MCFEQFKYCFIPYPSPPFITAFGQASLLPAQLAGDHNRLLGTAGGSGIPVGADSCPSPEGGALPTDQSPAPVSSGRRSAEVTDQRLYHESGTVPRTIPQQAVFGEKEGRVISSSGELEAFEPVYRQVPLQNGGDQHGEGSTAEERLDGLRRFERCLPFSSNRGRAQEVSPLCLGRPDVRISVSPLWIEQCPEGIHQAPETSSGPTQTSRDSSGDFLGRHVSTCPVKGRPGDPDGSDIPAVQPARLLHQPREISVEPNTADPILGVPDRLSQYDDPAYPGKSRAADRDMQNCQAGKSICARPSQACWQNDSHHPSNFPSSTEIPELTETEDPDSTQVSILRYHSRTGSRCPQGARVVDNVYAVSEWKEHFVSGTGFDDGVRCLPAGMGRSVRRCPHRRTLVSSREVVPHQLSRVDGRHVCGKSPFPGQGQIPHSPEARQPDGGGLYKPHGGDSLPSAEQPCYSAMGMVPGEGNDPVSRAPTRSRELCGRLRVQNNTVFSRVATPQGYLSEPDERGSPVRRGPICHTSEPSIAPICQLETRPLCRGDRCHADTMDQMEGLCFSTICSDQQDSQEGPGREVNDSSNCSSMGVPALVSNTPVHVSGLSSSAATPQQLADRSLWTVPPVTSGRPTSISRMDVIRQGYSAEGISREAAQLLLSGWSKGTNTAYQSAWKKWVSWCMPRKVDPLSCSVYPFLDFLASLFSTEQLQYRSINTIRSAVSMTHAHIEGVPMGQHPLVSRIFKGMYNSRLPQPRYTRTWDVDIMTRYLSSLGDNTSLSLKQLGHKLAILMALVSASRVSELQALDLRYRLYRPDGAHFELPSLGKKRAVGAPPKHVVFEAFPSDKKLCVVECLRRYEERTIHFRSGGADQPNPLFISYVKPHKAITSQRLAHWIKNIMEEAGIDITIFKAHSVRGASSTAAAEKGVLMADILRTADWSKDSTFKRFYYRPSSGNGYAQIMLQQKERKGDGKIDLMEELCPMNRRALFP